MEVFKKNQNKEQKPIENIESLIKQFEDFFVKLGFLKKESVGILAENDPTLIFINSTMAPFKHEISNNDIPENGLIIVQPCLRSNDQNLLFKEDQDVYWPSFFCMLGAIVKKEDGAKLFNHIVNFLESLGISKENLFIKTTTGSGSLNSVTVAFSNLNILNDSEDIDFYNWKYGIDGITGKGLTFSFKDKDGELQDLGNFISFNKEDENVIAWEMAFGIETLIARTNNKNVFETSMVSGLVEYRDSKEFRKLIDSIVCMVEIINAGVVPGPKKAEFILRKYIKAIMFLNKSVPQLNIEELLLKYSTLRGYDVNQINKIYKEETERQKLEKEKNIARFTNYYTKNKKMGIDWFKFAHESYSLDKEDVENVLKNY